MVSPLLWAGALSWWKNHSTAFGPNLSGRFTLCSFSDFSRILMYVSVLIVVPLGTKCW